MENIEKHIELYPGNWLYNAGCIGFLSVLERCNVHVADLLLKDGTIKGDIANAFRENQTHKGFEVPEIIWQWFISSGVNLKNDFDENGDDPIKDIWGTLFNVVYRGFFNANSNLLYAPSKTSPAVFESFLKFVAPLFEYEDSNPTCTFCMKQGNQTRITSYNVCYTKLLRKLDEMIRTFKELRGGDFDDIEMLELK